MLIYMKSNYTIIGIMSGTSLDGLDITLTNYILDNNQWRYNFVFGKTYSYPEEIIQLLKEATTFSAEKLLLLDKKLGQLFGDTILQFMKDYSVNTDEIDAIASHGHTIFHQPEQGFTYQIGCGTTIALKSQLPVINDFRTKDVILGGQGAPLVPVGDFQLFNSLADGFLNIGGISNISFKQNNKIQAHDICPGNIPLNLLMYILGKSYDKGGELASTGIVNQTLLTELNSLDFYLIPGPKSLGMEWLNKEFLPILNKNSDSIPNKLATICEHIGIQIAKIANSNKIQKLLVTGGGALNTYLIHRINHYLKGGIILPTKEIIEFKEAIVFGFLGALYLEKQDNCLKDVTGAQRNSCSGVLHLPN